MAVYRTQVGALAIKVEATEGTAETSSLTQTIRVQNMVFTPNINMFDRPVVADTFGTFSKVPGSKMATLSFDVAAAGASSLANLGTNGAECHLLYGAAQFDPALTPSTSAVYTLETTDAADMKSLTMRCYIDGLFFVLRGARCSQMQLVVAKPGDPILHRFTFQGVYDYEQGEGSTPAASYLTVAPAPCLSAALTVNSVSIVTSSISITHNTNIKLRESMNGADGYLSARITNPITTGTITFEPELVATFDLPSLIEDATEVALSFSSGTGTTANKLTVTAPKLQFTGHSQQNDGGLLKYAADFQLNRSSGDDSIVLSYTAG